MKQVAQGGKDACRCGDLPPEFIQTAGDRRGDGVSCSRGQLEFKVEKGSNKKEEVCLRLGYVDELDPNGTAKQAKAHLGCRAMGTHIIVGTAQARERHTTAGWSDERKAAKRTETWLRISRKVLTPTPPNVGTTSSYQSWSSTGEGQQAHPPERVSRVGKGRGAAAS